jgi:GNAT superfamily N-acetyltransferase
MATTGTSLVTDTGAPSIGTVAAHSAHRVAVEQTRLLRREVLRPHQQLHELAATEAADAFAAGVREGDELIAVGLIAPDRDSGTAQAWRVRGMCTAPGFRGHGAGAAVLQALLAHAAGAGAQAVWCNARAPARRFYERAGFRQTSGVFELPPIGPHVVMELELHPA